MVLTLNSRKGVGSALPLKATPAATDALVGVDGTTGAAVRLSVLALHAGPPGTTTFNPDGSITEVRGGVTIETTFGADGSIVAAYGPPIDATRTTTFNPDGSIAEVWS